jgi:hypothetical protein
MVQKTKNKQSSFRGKVASNAQRTSKQGTSFGYLRLPKSLQYLNPDPDGTLKLDFIPYIVTDAKHPDRDTEGTATKGTIWWRRPFMVHRNVGTEGDTVICLKSFGLKCPICEFRAKRKADGASNEELKAYNASNRNLYLVIPKGSRKFEEKLHIFDISDFCFQDLLTKELKEDPDKEIFPDLEEGYTLKIRFEPGTLATKNPYPQANRIDFIERDEQYDPKYIDSIPSLDDVLIQMSYSELKSKFLEGTEDVDNDVEEELEEIEIEEEERPRKKTNLPKRKVIEEEEDNEEELEEEEEEIPVKKKVTRKPVIDDDEDEEDIPVRKVKKPIKRVEDDDDEDEEDIKPKKKLMTSSKKTCPHGLKFGIDTEQYDVCDTCDIWNECVTEHEKK